MARVLVVDDEVGIRETLAEFLRDDGHDVRTADSVEGALALLEGDQVDVVVTDIIMPGTDGMELVRILRDSAPRAKVVLITGEPSFESAAEAVRLGAFDYIAKPVTQGAICRVVGSAMLVKQLEDENRRYQHNLERLVEARTRQIHAYTDRLRHIAEKTKDFARCSEVEILAPRILALFAQNMGADGGSFYRRLNDRLELVVSLGPDHQARRIELPARPGSVLARVIAQRDGFIVRNIGEENDLSSSGWSGYRDGSLLALPCIDADGDVAGVVTLHNKHDPPFTEEDLEIGRIIAGHTVEAIHSIELNNKLRDSERRYKDLAEHSLTGITLIQDGRVIYANPRAAEILGFSADEMEDLVGRSYLDLVHPEDRALNIERASRFRNEGLNEDRFEMRVLKRNGETTWIEALVSDVEHEGRAALLSNIIDVSDRKRAEEEVRRSRERLQMALDASNDGLFDWNMQDRTVYFSPRYFTMLGYAPDELPHSEETWNSLIHPDDRRIVSSCIQEYFAGRRDGHELEYRMKRKSGSFAWVLSRAKATLWDSSGKPCRMTGTHVDITERKETEEILRATELRVRSLIEHTTDAVFCYEFDEPIPTDLPVDEQVRRMYHCVLADCNLICARAYGFENVEDVLGKRLTDLFGTEPGSLDRLFRATVEGGYSIVDGEGVERLPDGSERYFINNGYGVVEDGRLVRIWGTFRDITDRKRAEEEKAQLSAQLLQSQKMEAIGRLAGGIAHDFNNILTAILGYAEIVSDKLGRGHPLWDEINEIIEAGERAAALTRQILAFSRRQIVEPCVVDLNEVVLRAKRMLARIIGEDIDLEVRTAPDLWRVRVDPGQIDQILVNLATNARDAMPNGGRVTIETANAPCPAAGAGMDETAAGESVALIMSDTGIGMDSLMQARVFEPFFSTKERGTGLGLSTVRDIISRHGGSVSLSSAPGQGSTFRIIFPRLSLDEQQLETRGDAPHARGGSETILLVEDDDAVRNLARTTLADLGYDVLVARDAEAARQVSNEHGGDIQLLITDIVLPGMNGRELFEILTPTRPTMKVLFMSGYTHDVISRRGILVEGIELLRKPFTLEALAVKVRDVLDA